MPVLAVVLAAFAFLAAGWIAWRYLYLRQAPPIAIESAESNSLKLSGSADNWCNVLSGEHLLQHCHAQPTLEAILRQTRLSPNVFDRDLRTALVAYAGFVQLAPASESHHHAHPGGLLAHTLEVLLGATTLRNGYLLPLGAPTELIDRQRDHWTYAVFLAALLHDIGKIMTDLRITARDTPQATARRWLPMSGPLTQSHATEYQIGFAPTHERDYLAHKKLALVLLQAVAPPNALAFLGRENTVLESVTAFLGGDAEPGTPAFEGAKMLAEIIKKADQQSVAHNLQHGPRDRFATASAVPLFERLMSTIRQLLAQGTVLPLNRDGAAGWVFDGAIYFVAKRLADTIRDQLQKAEGGSEGIPGPSKNDRLFDTWQDYGAIDLNPITGQAIWHVTVEGEGYAHGLAMLRFPLHRLYGDDPARYPPPMTGRITLVDKAGKGSAKAGPAPGQGAIANPDGTAPRHDDAQLPLVLPSDPGSPASRSPTDRARQGEPDDLIEADEPVPAMPLMPPPVMAGPPALARSVGRSSGKEIQAPRPPKPAERKKLAQLDVKPPKTSSASAVPPAAPVTSAPAKPSPKGNPVPTANHSADEPGDLLDEADAVRGSRRKVKPTGTAAERQAVAPYAVPPKLASETVEPTPLAVAFIEWVQHGLASGNLTYNEPGSPVHFLPAGMALVSPRIFRDYAESVGEENSNAVQQQVIAAGWNIKAAGNSNILHFAVVKRDGVRAGKLSAVVIAHPERWVSPLPPVNGSIVPFELGAG